MGRAPDGFEKFSFDQDWEEEDWERFFDAQDRLSRDRRWRTGHPSERPSVDPSLSFRRVLSSFGMDPDNPESPPRPFALDQTLAPDGARGLPFWHPGADPERLPLFIQAAEFYRRITELLEIRFAKILAKSYTRASYRQFQKILPEIEARAAQIPRLVALGHRAGYDSFGVKGHIVRCRRALENAEASLTLLSRIPRGPLGRDLYRSVFAEAVRLRNALLIWIDLLRTRFAARPRRAR